MKVQDRISLFIKKDGFQPEAYHVCPVFDRCSCNICFLDKDVKLRTYNEIDQQRKCKCPKRIRKEIGTYFNLPNKGLTSREISGAKRWDNLSQEQKDLKTANLKQNSPFVRLKSKGYAITRVSKQNTLFTLQTAVEPPINSVETHVSMTQDPSNAPATQPFKAGDNHQAKLLGVQE